MDAIRYPDPRQFLPTPILRREHAALTTAGASVTVQSAEPSQDWLVDVAQAPPAEGVAADIERVERLAANVRQRLVAASSSALAWHRPDPQRTAQALFGPPCPPCQQPRAHAAAAERPPPAGRRSS